MRVLSLLFFVISLTFLSCNIQSNELIGKWTHAREKDHDGLQVYVKGENPDLPPARYRQVFVFLNEKDSKHTSVGANDAHEMQTSIYSLTKEELLIKNKKGDILFRFKVINSTPTEMTLLKI